MDRWMKDLWYKITHELFYCHKNKKIITWKNMLASFSVEIKVVFLLVCFALFTFLLIYICSSLLIFETGFHFTIQPWVAWKSLGRPIWPQIHIYLSVFESGKVGLQKCNNHFCHFFSSLFLFCFLDWDKDSLYTPGCIRSQSELSVSIHQVLGLKICTTMLYVWVHAYICSNISYAWF